jgi:hypothetical protein
VSTVVQQYSNGILPDGILMAKSIFASASGQRPRTCVEGFMTATNRLRQHMVGCMPVSATRRSFSIVIDAHSMTLGTLPAVALGVNGVAEVKLAVWSQNESVSTEASPFREVSTRTAPSLLKGGHPGIATGGFHGQKRLHCTDSIVILLNHAQSLARSRARTSTSDELLEPSASKG